MKKITWVVSAWFDDKSDERLFREKLKELHSFAEICIIKQQKKIWSK
jgi:hypothetical protein